MSFPYVGEIRIFAGTKAPKHWAICDGRELSKKKYPELYTVIGTTYGGDGDPIFLIPDLQGRIPIHLGQGHDLDNHYTQGQADGVERVSMIPENLPSHNHKVHFNKENATLKTPENNVPATADSARNYPYSDTEPNVEMLAGALEPTGNDEDHSNMMPSLCLNYIIALHGLIPPRT